MRDIDRLIDDLRRCHLVAIDTETTGLQPYGGDRLRGISLAYERDDGTIETHYLNVSHPGMPPDDVERVVEMLQREDLALVFHNAPFDWHFLASIRGWRRPHGPRYRDTQVLSWLHQENGSHALKVLGAIHFGLDASEEQRALQAVMRGRSQIDVYRELRADPEWKARPAAEAKAAAREIAAASKKTWQTISYDDIEAYARQDARLTYDLYQVMTTWIDARAEMGKEDVRPAIQREHDVQHVLYEMTRLGVRINVDKARRLLADTEHHIEQIKSAFLREHGVDIDKPRQVANLVYRRWGLPCHHRTNSGAPSVNRFALEALEGAHDGVDDILRYRRLAKAASTYLRPLLDLVGSDGRVHSFFSSCNTVTGRLSSSNPNLMTIPRADTLTGIRDVFEAEPGMELWEYDLLSAELRVAAAFTREHAIADALLNGRDLHNETAERIFGPNFTSLQRRLAKNLNFGYPYGIGPRKFAMYMVSGTGQSVTQCQYWAQSIGPQCGRCHVCQAAAIIDGFRRAYPSLTGMMRYLARVAERQGYLPLHVPGRYRRFRAPGIQVPSYTALNAIVQGGVAEFMKDLMLHHETVTSPYGRLVLQVHDSLVFETEPGAGRIILDRLNRLSDDLNPFGIPMPFNGKPWRDDD
jgi:DNA polymerase I-like protein with 3'-5' exonuclease and polymerase domains